MTPADLEFISYALSPFEGEPVFLLAYDALLHEFNDAQCWNCGFVVRTDWDGFCPNCDMRLRER